MFDLATTAMLVLIGLVAVAGIIVASGIRLQRFFRPVAIILTGVLIGNVVFVLIIILARLPLALDDYQAGIISAAEILPTALFYFSWFPILTPGFYLFGLFGALATVSLYTIFVHWRRIQE